MKDLFRRIVFLILFLEIVCMIFAQTSPDWLWVSSASGSGGQIARCLSVDSDGNQYVAGSFESITVFSEQTVTSAGNTDIYVGKLDSNGNWIWAQRAGGSESDEPWGIALDASSNIYITGTFSNTANFGEIEIGSEGNKDIFVAKLDNSGNWLWASGAGSTGEDYGYSLTALSDGTCYVTGYIYDTATFGEHQISPFGYTDIFLAQIGSDGIWQWVQRAGGTNLDKGKAVATDHNGNVYLSGTFRNMGTFGELSLSSNGQNDVFVAKLDALGNWLWALNCGGSSYDDDVFDIDVNSSGVCCITGEFYSTGVFGDIEITSSNNRDAFVAALDSLGNWLWATRAGGFGTDSGNSVVIDNNSAVYVSGNFQNTIDLGSLELSSSGIWDIFIAGIDSSGEWKWADSAGSGANDFAGGIALGEENRIYVHGTFSGTSSFGEFELPTSGGFDIFVAKLSLAGISVEDELIPEFVSSAYLHNAIPNPVIKGSIVKVKTHLSVNESATLELFNVRGQLLATYPVFYGIQTHDFNSNNLSSGIYLYRLKTANTSIVKKLTVIR